MSLALARTACAIEVPCTPEINRFLKAYDPAWKVEALPSESGDFGPSSDQSVRLTVATPARVILSRFTPQTETQIEFRAPGCEGIPTYLPVVRKGFDEFELDRILTHSRMKKTRGLIYLWSPLMPYSVQGLSEVRKAAQASGVELSVAVDPLVDSADLAPWLRAGQITGADTRPLLTRNMTLAHRQRLLSVHYPTLFFYADGEFKNQGLPGFLKQSRYQAAITQVFRP